jgi:L-asparaginase II
MLRASKANSWALDSYLTTSHPLQLAITEHISEIAGPVSPIGVDGCGAPVFATSARAMARAFAHLASDPEFDAVFDAMHAFPALVSGYGNVDAALATHLNAVAKRGAAGCLGFALRPGLGLAVKVWDGDGTVAGVALVAALDQLGLLTEHARALLSAIAEPTVFGGGRPVGVIRSRLELKWE